MGHVVKASQVQYEGPCQLSLDAGVAGRRATGRPPSASPGIRIAEKHADHAVLEVTCSCGQTTRVRCEYATAEAGPTGEAPPR
jgi:hypothetical protein